MGRHKHALCHRTKDRLDGLVCGAASCDAGRRGRWADSPHLIPEGVALVPQYARSARHVGGTTTSTVNRPHTEAVRLPFGSLKLGRRHASDSVHRQRSSPTFIRLDSLPSEINMTEYDMPPA